MKMTFNQLKTMIDDVGECMVFVRQMIARENDENFNELVSKTFEYLKAYKDYLQYEKEWE